MDLQSNEKRFSCVNALIYDMIITYGGFYEEI